MSIITLLSTEWISDIVWRLSQVNTQRFGICISLLTLDLDQWWLVYRHLWNCTPLGYYFFNSFFILVYYVISLSLAISLVHEICQKFLYETVCFLFPIIRCLTVIRMRTCPRKEVGCCLERSLSLTQCRPCCPSVR